MKNVDMEAKIRQAFEHATPNVLESVLSDCREQKGTVIVMKERKNNWTWKLAACAAAVAMVVGLGAGGVLYRTNRAVAATISLDVNPSVALTVNRKDRVLAVDANNEDGKTIIGSMDLTGSDLEVAVNALVGSMVRNGYLNDLANSVLVSVDSKDAETGTALQEKLANEVSLLLENERFSGAVISQTVEKSDSLTHYAEEYHISVGKANLIQQIISQDSRYEFEELADRSINELKLISQSPAIQLEHTSEVGAASEKEYIGRDAALQVALAQIKATAEEISAEEIDLEFEDGVMVYDIELIYQGGEYEFEIDAKTGACRGYSYPEAELEIDEDFEPDTTIKVQESVQYYIGNDKASEIAVNHAGVEAEKVKNLECELDVEDGSPHYDVEFDANGYEYDYEIDALNGKIRTSEKEKDKEKEKAQVPTGTKELTSGKTENLIGKDRAKQIALEHAGIKTSAAKNVKCELDRDDGKVRYEVEFHADGYEFDYEIDATSGKVISSEKERDD